LPIQVKFRVECIRTKPRRGNILCRTLHQTNAAKATRVDVAELAAILERKLHPDIGRLCLALRQKIQRSIGAEMHGERPGRIDVHEQNLPPAVTGAHASTLQASSERLHIRQLGHLSNPSRRALRNCFTA
jgi:hypothetical protein